MQIVRTEVMRMTASSGQPIHRVLFRGESDECVAVDMVDSGTDDRATIDRARKLLVQTATFELPVNDYDAQSNGNLDELAITRAAGNDGSVYIFEYREGEGSRRVPRATMPSLEAAREEAVRCAVDLLLDLRSTDKPTGWLVRLLDEKGELLCTIDVEEAEKARQARS